MPDLDWNRSYWGSDYEWPHGGEEWSEAWGGSFTQWHTLLLPRLASSLPAASIIEIAPGHGRWTRFLLPGSTRYRGYDLSSVCVATCRRVFAGALEGRDVQFLVNDGHSFGPDDTGQADLVFSFDSLVHVEMDVMRSYLREVARVLRPGGRAFLHHSNLGMYGGAASSYAHERGRTVSAATVGEAAAEAGLAVRVQEIVSWKTRECIDCFSILEKGAPAAAPVLIENPGFWEATAELRRTIAPYATLSA